MICICAQGEIPKIQPPKIVTVLPHTQDWSIAAPDRTKYMSLFESLHPVDGLLPGNKVRSVLMDSKLPLDALSRIWDLADQDKDGSLDRHEFLVVSVRYARPPHHLQFPTVISAANPRRPCTSSTWRSTRKPFPHRCPSNCNGPKRRSPVPPPPPPTTVSSPTFPQTLRHRRPCRHCRRMRPRWRPPRTFRPSYRRCRCVRHRFI